MPTISNVVRDGAPDSDGNATFTVTVVPDEGAPGHGLVSDQRSHSSPWSSATGDPADMLIFGAPPFRATQFHLTHSDWADHEPLRAAAPERLEPK